MHVFAPNPAEMAEVKRILSASPEFLAELGVSPSDIEEIVYGGAPPPRTDAFIERVRGTRVKHVGQGHYAHAFALPNGLVLKVTLDDNDAQAAELVRRAWAKGENPPGLPRVELVRKLSGLTRHIDEEYSKPEPLYAIVIEPLVGLQREGTWGLKTALAWMADSDIWSVEDALAQRARYYGETGTNWPAALRNPEFVRKIEEGMRGVRWLKERGFVVRDLHVGNFGETADGRTVLLDFGDYSKDPKRRRVPVATAKNPLPVDNDTATGIGATGYNQDVDYFGLRVLMKPSTFHRLTPELPRERAPSADWMKGQVAAGRAFGAPSLGLKIPAEWEDGDFAEPAEVHSHEGRNRMYASRELYGDNDLVEVHLFPLGRRNRDMTAAWIERINGGLVSERHGRYGDWSMRETRGPLFEKVLNAQSGRSSGWRAGLAKNPAAKGLAPNGIVGELSRIEDARGRHVSDAPAEFPRSFRDAADFEEVLRPSDWSWVFLPDVPVALLGPASEADYESELELEQDEMAQESLDRYHECQDAVLNGVRFAPVLIDMGGAVIDGNRRLAALHDADPAATVDVLWAKSSAKTGLMPNANRRLDHVHASFNRHFDEAERVFPDLGTVELHEDEEAGSDNGAGSERQFGYCADEKPIVIAFAPKTESLPKKYIDGLMAHEFGHAIEFRYGRRHLEKLWSVKLPESIERRADKIAEHTFGRPIEYGDLDIQCIGCGGKKTRPRRLG
jgi:hypothetical protein